MAKPKYVEYYQRMINVNKEIFENFKKVHDEYGLNPEKHQDKLNAHGEKIMLIIQEWENKLCMQSEKGGYGIFTTKLADKFRNEVRKSFPNIDCVGIKIDKFKLKKINLN